MVLSIHCEIPGPEQQQSYAWASIHTVFECTGGWPVSRPVGWFFSALRLKWRAGGMSMLNLTPKILNRIENWKTSRPTHKTLDTLLLQPFLRWHSSMGHRPVLHKLQWLQFIPISKSTACLLLLVISKRFELERWDCARIVGLFKQFVKLKVFCSSLFLRWDIGGVGGRIFIS